MVPANLVRAQVVDIASPKTTFPHQIVVDASVLYFVHYPNFDGPRRGRESVGHAEPAISKIVVGIDFHLLVESLYRLLVLVYRQIRRA